jgi:hypothetical protein
MVFFYLEEKLLNCLSIDGWYIPTDVEPYHVRTSMEVFTLLLRFGILGIKWEGGMGMSAYI